MKRIRYRLTAVICAFALLLAGYTAFAAEPYGPGDGNGDGKVNSSDARLALRIAAMVHQGTAQERKACDVNYNGSVTSYDARMILCVAARIYDMSYITPTTGDPSKTTVTTTETGRGDSVPWDLIVSTTARVTEERTTLPPPTHPNNYYTKHTETTSETTAAPVPPTTAVPIPPEPGTTPVAPTDEGGTTDTTVSPTTETPTATAPTVVTTAPPVEERTHFSITLKREADGILAFTFSVKNALGLKSGVLSVDFDSTVLQFVAAEENEEIGARVIIRPAPMPDEVGCEFSFSEPLIAESFTFGTVRFRVINANAESTDVGVSVRGSSSYNWQTDGGSVIMPDRCVYHLYPNGSASDTSEIESTASPAVTTEEPSPTDESPTRIPGDTETASLSIALNRPGDGSLVFTLKVKDAQALKSGMLNVDFDPGVLEFVAAEGVDQEGVSVNLRPTPAPGTVGCEFSFRDPLCAEEFVLGTVTFRVIGDAENTSVSAAVQEPAAYNWRTEAIYVITPERCSYYVLLK
ncbi:MAG: hypothetical protein IK118_07285 [Clostridia bacterium]|nr:hypothetical protein [Clostridia bacterium]